MKPIFEQILIKPEPHQNVKSKSGILLTNDLEKGQEIVRGECIAIGNEAKYVEVGDKVYYDRYVARKITKDGEETHAILWKEVIAIDRD